MSWFWNLDSVLLFALFGSEVTVYMPFLQNYIWLVVRKKNKKKEKKEENIQGKITH